MQSIKDREMERQRTEKAFKKYVQQQRSGVKYVNEPVPKPEDKKWIGTLFVIIFFGYLILSSKWSHVIHSPMSAIGGWLLFFAFFNGTTLYFFKTETLKIKEHGRKVIGIFKRMDEFQSKDETPWFEFELEDGMHLRPGFQRMENWIKHNPVGSRVELYYAPGYSETVLYGELSDWKKGWTLRLLLTSVLAIVGIGLIIIGIIC